jgi:hypothetical protein
MGAFKPSTLAAALAAVTFGISASADDKKDNFRTRLSGYNSTKASGSFRGEIHDRMQLIDYELSYRDLEGTVTQAHIHFGQRHTTGGIVAWLCQSTTNPSPTAGTPVCPGPNSGTVTGTITAAQVITVTGQGIDAGEFDELVRAMRAGATYVNVHSSTFGPGEIRGHLDSRGRGHH